VGMLLRMHALSAKNLLAAVVVGDVDLRVVTGKNDAVVACVGGNEDLLLLRGLQKEKRRAEASERA